MVDPEYHVSEHTSEASEAVAVHGQLVNAVRIIVDLSDVLGAISDSANLAVDALRKIEFALLKIDTTIHSTRRIPEDMPQQLRSPQTSQRRKP